MVRRRTSGAALPACVLLAAFAGACASRGAAPPIAPPAQPNASPVSTDAPPIAAGAGAIFVFRSGADFASEAKAPAAAIERMRAQFRALSGFDFADAPGLAHLGADPQRPIVVSWGVVEPARLRELLAAPKMPPLDTPFAIRFQIVYPLADAAISAARLAEIPLDASCARRQGDAGLWAALLARLPTPDDRRAAEAAGAAYVCRGAATASVARLDADRRELIWVSAFGGGSLLAAAATPPALDGPLAARLRRDGFFAARAGVYTTPAAEARAQVALDLVKVRTGIAGVEDEMRDRLWRQAVWEMGAPTRLLESDPRLFVDVMIADHASSWTLTPEGRTFFSSLGLGARTDAARLRQAIATQLKPIGLFANPKALSQTMQEGGSGTFMLLSHFLWPHGVAFAAAHAEDSPPPTVDWAGGSAQVDVDAPAGVLRIHADNRR